MDWTRGSDDWNAENDRLSREADIEAHGWRCGKCNFVTGDETEFMYHVCEDDEE